MTGFDKIYGQELIVEKLKNSIAEGKISHAYIIEGEKYSGKEFIANVFSRAILCREAERPCDSCSSCKKIKNRNHPDVVYLSHEKPALISVDEIREQVNEKIYIKPFESEKKIIIIEDAEKMNANAQNALLKTLEEPPEYGIIILLTENTASLLPTILSRCITFKMKPVKDSLVKEFLQKEVHIPDYRAEICAAFARGNIGKAKILATSEDFDRIKVVVFNIIKNVKHQDYQELMSTVKDLGNYKLQMDDLMDIMAIWYRDVLLFKATSDYNGLVLKDESEGIRKMAQSAGYEGIENILEALESAKKRISANVSFDLTMELLLKTMKENS